MYLEHIEYPDDLKKLTLEQLSVLAEEIRSAVIKRTAVNGGHLASNLGVVELTIAMHYIFNAPEDKFIWDVGHQSYVHKLLTGRKKLFHTLRRHGGISGFPKIAESPYDAFGTGHSSTSISAALGIAEARDRLGKKFKVIAVIGDGALSGGLAFEGLNHAGHLKKDMIVILNDNEMSISPNVGAVSAYLNKILTSDFYKKFRKETKAFLEQIPKIGGSVARIAERAEGSIKGFILPGAFFEDLGFNYIGPIDGHDLMLMTETFKKVREISEPLIIHVVTQKGRGYKFSEDDPCGFHGVGPFEMETGTLIKVEASSITEDLKTSLHKPRMCSSMSEVFGKTLTVLAEGDSSIVAVTAAMKEGTGLSCFAEKNPDRIYDVGIAEGHAVTFSAGMAAQGLKPVIAVYSTFIQRAIDQIVHDVCLQNLPVVFAIDRAGIVGEDGPTHHGIFDISLLRSIPNMNIMSPADGAELAAMLAFALDMNAPCAIRYPRGKAYDIDIPEMRQDISMGRGVLLFEGDDAAIIALGNMVLPALKAAAMLKEHGINAAVAAARFVKPLDKELILDLAKKTGRIITVEDGAAAGGFGSAVLEMLNNSEADNTAVKILGIQDRFVEHGTQQILLRNNGLDEEGICNAVRAFISRTASGIRS
ncbi:MAG: 1-deoxy-D-xylulose-5-phosphate synthase [Dissulfurispiraceae bacterium]|jgi:1-deoxy-D-xylulose-5-phosphate synthase|nr:1-deoxy-D-xylulose-5-phosphate synthase [Dissulfurispiraceae bacterium]